MTTGVTGKLSQAEQDFYQFIYEPAVKIGEGALAAAAPILANPILEGIDNEVINLVADAIFQRIKLLVDVTSIKLIDAKAESKFTSESEALAIMATEQGVESDAYKAARAQALKDFGVFTSIIAG